MFHHFICTYGESERRKWSCHQFHIQRISRVPQKRNVSCQLTNWEGAYFGILFSQNLKVWWSDWKSSGSSWWLPTLTLFILNMSEHALTRLFRSRLLKFLHWFWTVECADRGQVRSPGIQSCRAHLHSAKTIGPAAKSHCLLMFAQLSASRIRCSCCASFPCSERNLFTRSGIRLNMGLSHMLSQASLGKS